MRTEKTGKRARLGMFAFSIQRASTLGIPTTSPASKDPLPRTAASRPLPWRAVHHNGHLSGNRDSRRRDWWDTCVARLVSRHHGAARSDISHRKHTPKHVPATNSSSMSRAPGARGTRKAVLSVKSPDTDTPQSLPPFASGRPADTFGSQPFERHHHTVW